MHREAIDTSDPRSELERAEDESAAPTSSNAASADAIRRLLAWCLDGATLSQVGLRVHVAASKLQIDPTAPSLEKIASLAGYGRSAANNVAREFTETFGIKGPHDRSEEARKSYSDAYWQSRDRSARSTRQAVPA